MARSTPDGYTLLMTSAGILTANQFLYASMPFDPEKDFVTVSNVADMPMMVVVNPKVEAKTLAELVALARANPNKLNFGSPGIGTTGHLGLAMFMHAADVKITQELLGTYLKKKMQIKDHAYMTSCSTCHR